MSILLEALRKSEKGQRTREAPTIHTDNPPGTAIESLPIAPLALLLAVALLLAGWFVWKQYQPPAGFYQPPVTLKADRARAVSKTADEKITAQAEPSPPPAAAAAPQNRTPVETYQAPPETENEAATSEPEAAPKKRLGVSSPGADATSVDDSIKTVARETATQQPVESSPEPYRPGEPEPISYWELPDAVRSSVPEMKFSVLVYAADPADRFVLINGQRLGEGDSVQAGLVVKEIRREGVVFSYRLYQFLVER